MVGKPKTHERPKTPIERQLEIDERRAREFDKQQQKWRQSEEDENQEEFAALMRSVGRL